MEPTVGRVVYYKSPGSMDGYHSQNRAAIITIVNSPTNVGLCVLNPRGMLFRTSVDQGSEPGQWDWMPYQKAQAGK
jgi:hypothetical protein